MTDEMTDSTPRSQSFRRFELVRSSDPTGVSGTGVVARGIEFPTGTAVIEWDATNHDIDAENGLAIKPGPDGVAAVLEVHGHDGATELNWLDTPGSSDQQSAAGADGDANANGDGDASD